MKTTINKIKALIATAEKFKNAYFFSPASNAQLRQSYDKYHSIPEFTWVENGHAYTCEYIVSSTSSYVSAKGYYTKDGKKTTLTAIKNSLKRLEGEIK